MSSKNDKTFRSYVYDHWLVILPFMLALVGATAFDFVRNALFTLISWRYSGWIVLAVVISWSVMKKQIKNKEDFSGVVRPALPPPRYKHEEYNPVEQHGVNWRFWRGASTPPSFNELLGDAGLRSWVDGPYCVSCEYELDESSDGTKWTCANGHKPVKIPKSLQGNYRRKMIKAFDAELRQQESQGKK